MAELSPVSRGSYDMSFAGEETPQGSITSGLEPPPVSALTGGMESEPEGLPLGYDSANNKMYVNGFVFDADDHQAALDAKAAFDQPVTRKMPANFRSVSGEEYTKYIQDIRNPSMSRLISKNFGIGIDNLQLLGGYGLHMAGFEDTGGKLVEQQLQDLRKNQPYQRMATDVESPGGAIDWFVANLAQQGPNLISSVLAAVAGSVAGGPVALGALVGSFGGKIGLKNAVTAAAKKHMQGGIKALSAPELSLLKKMSGATLASAAQSYGMFAVPDIYGEMMEGSDTGKVSGGDKAKALALGIPYALAESLPTLLGAGFFLRGKGGTLKGGVKGGRLKRGAKGFGVGGLGEGLTEVQQEAIVASQNPKLTDVEKRHRYWNAFWAGLGVGGPISGAGALMRPVKDVESSDANLLEQAGAQPEGTQPEEGQLELFPGEDLGTRTPAPPGFVGRQGELFPEDDLGVSPELDERLNIQELEDRIDRLSTLEQRNLASYEMREELAALREQLAETRTRAAAQDPDQLDMFDTSDQVGLDYLEGQQLDLPFDGPRPAPSMAGLPLFDEAVRPDPVAPTPPTDPTGQMALPLTGGMTGDASVQQMELPLGTPPIPADQLPQQQSLELTGMAPIADTTTPVYVPPPVTNPAMAQAFERAQQAQALQQQQQAEQDVLQQQAFQQQQDLAARNIAAMRMQQDPGMAQTAIPAFAPQEDIQDLLLKDALAFAQLPDVASIEVTPTTIKKGKKVKGALRWVVTLPNGQETEIYRVTKALGKDNRPTGWYQVIKDGDDRWLADKKNEAITRLEAETAGVTMETVDATAKATQPNQDRSQESGPAKLVRKKPPSGTSKTGTGAATLKDTGSRSRTTKGKTKTDKLKKQDKSKKEDDKPAGPDQPQPTERKDQQPVNLAPPLTGRALAAANWDELATVASKFPGQIRSWSALVGDRGAVAVKVRKEWEKLNANTDTKAATIVSDAGGIITFTPEATKEAVELSVKFLKLQKELEAVQNKGERIANLIHNIETGQDVPNSIKDLLIIALFDPTSSKDTTQLKLLEDINSAENSLFATQDLQRMVHEQFENLLKDPSVIKPSKKTRKVDFASTVNGVLQSVRWVDFAHRQGLLPTVRKVFDTNINATPSAKITPDIAVLWNNIKVTESTVLDAVQSELIDNPANRRIMELLDQFTELSESNLDVYWGVSEEQFKAIQDEVITRVRNGVALEANEDVDTTITHHEVAGYGAKLEVEVMPDLTLPYREAPLSEWVDAKTGKIKVRNAPAIRQGEVDIQITTGKPRMSKRVVLATPEGVTPTFAEDKFNNDTTTVTDGRYSRWNGAPITNPLSFGMIKSAISRATKVFNTKIAPSFKPYRSVEDLRQSDPATYREAVAARKGNRPIPNNAAGYAYTVREKDGSLTYKVLIFQQNILNHQHLRFVMAHEAIGHLGLRTVIPDREFNSLMDDLYTRDSGIKARADSHMDMYGYSKREAIEEALADVAGDIESHLLTRIGAALKNFFNKLGFVFEDDMTRYFVFQSRRYLRTGTIGDLSPLGISLNVKELQRRYVEGRFSQADHLASSLAGQHAAAAVHTKNALDWALTNVGSGSTLSSWLGRGLKLIQSLNNQALHSEGLKRLFTIFTSQYEHIRALQSKYNNMTRFSNAGRVTTWFNNLVTNDPVDALSKVEQDQTNQLLYINALHKGQLINEAELDNLGALLKVDATGESVVDANVLEKLQERGNLTQDQFANGVSYIVYNDKGERDTVNSELMKIDFKITDRVWKAFNQQRKVVDEGALDVYRAKVYGMIQTRERELTRLQTKYDMTDNNKETLRALSDHYVSSRGKTAKSREKAYKDVRNVIRVMHEKWGKKKLDDWLDPSITEADDAVTPEMKAVMASLKDLSETTVSENDTKKIVRAILDLSLLDAQLTNAEARAKMTIAGGYVPFVRRGDWQVRLVALDQDGNEIALEEHLKGMMTYTRTEKDTQAIKVAEQLEAVFESFNKNPQGSTMLSAQLDSNGNPVPVKISKIEARAERAMTTAPFAGTINYDDMMQTITRAGVTLSAMDREKLVKLTTSHHSLARKNLWRRGNPGWDPDAMRAIAEHLETQSHLAGKNRYQHQVAEVLSDNKLWHGNTSRLREIQANYIRAVETGNEAKIFDARKALVEYQRMYVAVQPINKQVEIIAPIAGNPLNKKLVKGKGKGNDFRGDATKLVSFYRDTRNLADATTEGIVGKWAQPMISIVAASQLGGALAPAIVNLSSLWSHAIPYLATYNKKTGYGGGHGIGRASMEIGRAMRDVRLFRGGFADKFGNAKGLEDLVKEARSNPQAFENKYNLTLDEIVFVEALTENGVLTPNMWNAMMGTSRTGKRGGLGQATDVWMKMFSKTEQYNRRVTALASYRLEKQRLRDAGVGASEADFNQQLADPNSSISQELYRRATTAVDTSQGNYSQFNRPHWARGNIFQFFYIYKQFVVITVELMRNLAPKERTAMFAMLLLLTGVKGFPFGDDIMDGLDTIAQAFNIRWEGSEAWLAKQIDGIAPGLTPWVMRGILDNTLGYTVSSRLGHADIIPGTGMARAGADVGRELEAILGPIASFIPVVIQTSKLLGRQGLEGLGIREDTTTWADIGREGFGINLVKSMTEGILYLSDGTVTNKRGQVISKEASIGLAIGRMMGFYPAAATMQYDVNRMASHTREYAKELKMALRDAYIKGSPADRRRILREVVEINKGARGTPFFISNFQSGAQRALRAARQTASQRSFKAMPKDVKQLSGRLMEIYGLD